MRAFRGSHEAAAYPIRIANDGENIMEYEAITVEVPLSPHIGAEIGNIDLTFRPLPNKQGGGASPGVASNTRSSSSATKRSDFDDQIHVLDAILARAFRQPYRKKSTISKTTDNQYVRKFHYDETSTQISGENFHSDQSCGAIPPLGSILYNHTVPPDGGGDTMFATLCTRRTTRCRRACEPISPD